MSRHTSDLPDPLLAAGATDFERRILDAGAHEDPSAEASKRMALALGISAGVATVAVTGKVAAAAAAKTAAGATSVVVWPWISIGVLGLVVTGALVGSRHWKSSERDVRRASASATLPAPAAPPAPATPEATPVKTAPSEVASPAPARRARPSADDLREQIALIDAARAALTADAAERTLQLVRRYHDKFASGAFRPEAAALKIEALVALGRRAEAKTLAETFVAEHRGTALADRVASIAGVNKR
jgi:hypothetical protein